MENVDNVDKWLTITDSPGVTGQNKRDPVPIYVNLSIHKSREALGHFFCA